MYQREKLSQGNTIYYVAKDVTTEKVRHTPEENRNKERIHNYGS